MVFVSLFVKLPGAETLYKKVRNQQYLTLKFKLIFSAQVPAEATNMVLNLLIFVFGPPGPPRRALPLHPAGACGPWTPARFQCFSFRVILMPVIIIIIIIITTPGARMNTTESTGEMTATPPGWKVGTPSCGRRVVETVRGTVKRL